MGVVLSNVDINQNFTKEVNVSTSTELKSINNSISNILFTRKGERVGDIDFGASLEDFLFGMIDDTTAYLIGDRILDNITYYEKRINVDSIIIQPDYVDNLYSVKIKFTILDLNIEEEYTNLIRVY